MIHKKDQADLRNLRYSASFFDTGETTISPARHLCVKDVYVINMYSYNAQIFDMAIKLMQNAKQFGIPTGEMVTHRFGLDGVEKAMKVQDKLECMKAVILP